MKRILLATAALTLAAAPAMAKENKHAGHPPGHAAAPGLAKKPMGLPPGQAKKVWRQGERLPSAYYSQQQYYIDPARYRLSAPPAGYRWVRVDDDAYLVQSRTGLISRVIADLLG